MANYTRTTTVDSAPSGDSVKQAILDLDTDLTGHVAAYNAHDTATTSVHGFTGTKTGSGAMVGATSPTLVTPVLGVATATSINKVALTAPATSATLTIADGKTLTCSNTLTLAGTDSTTITFPSTSCTVARTDAANSFTGTQTITDTATDTSADFLTITATIRETSDATHNHIGIASDVSTYAVDGLTTNSGSLAGIQANAYINSASHSGTLAQQAGVSARSGIYMCGFGGAVTATYAGYFGVINNSANGTITNAYGVYIYNAGVVGTMTNRYGLSIAASAGSGTLSMGVEIGSLSGTQSIKTGMKINAISGASTTNYGIHIGNVSGATNNYSIYTGTGDVRFGGLVNTTEHYEVDGTQVISNRVVDARCDDTINTSAWDSTTAGVLDSLRDAMVTHGLIAAS